MCFTKSSPSVAPVVSEDPVVRKEANASLTKNSSANPTAQGFQQNIKTSAFGIEENANTSKKTLLGE